MRDTGIMDTPLISVIIPVFNVERYLDRCIDSVVRQDYRNFELIIVDDGSTDGSGAICDKWAGTDSRITVVHQKNKGLSGARNTGIDMMKGQMVSFIDADDYVSENYLSYLLSLYPEDPGCSVVACNHFVVRKGKNKPESVTESDKMHFSRQEAFENVLFGGAVNVSAWAKLYRREVFDNIRFPEGRLFEDTWVFGDILMKTGSFVFGNTCCYYYEMHGSSIVNRGFNSKDLEYIDSAKRLAAAALECDPGLKTGAVRRINHARLSVLRKMSHCSQEYKSIRKEMRKQIISESGIYLKDPGTPRRDRIAVAMLKMGFFPFYAAWRIYTVFQ